MVRKFYIIIHLIGLSIFSVAQDIPEKELERNIEAGKIYKEEDAEEKEKVYLSWIKKYPPRQFANSIMLYEYIKAELSKAFVKEGKIKKAIQYSNQLTAPNWRSEGWAEIAGVMVEANFPDQAAELYRKSITNATSQLSNEKDSIKLRSLDLQLTHYNYRLGSILYQQKNFSEALDYSKYAYLHNSKDDLNIALLYADLLMESNSHTDAFYVLEKEMLSGKPNTAIKARLKNAYYKTKDTVNWIEYLSKLESSVHDKRKNELRKQMISIPAPPFTLYDLETNIVSLSDYKGKIVVIDFWATWCIPCRQSFPFMQKAVNRFTDSMGVHFLFIHTWEKENHAIKEARDFMKKYNYNFHVLMDLKDPVTEVNNIVFAYKVDALPAKFLLDKNGVIRFVIEPHLDNDEYALEELKIMIELASE